MLQYGNSDQERANDTEPWAINEAQRATDCLANEMDQRKEAGELPWQAQKSSSAARSRLAHSADREVSGNFTDTENLFDVPISNN